MVEEKEEKESEEEKNRKSLTSNLKGGHFDQRKQNIVKTTKQFFSKHLFIFSFYLGLFTKAGKAHKRGAMTILGKLNGVNMRALLMQPLQKIPEKLWLRQTNALNTMMLMMMMMITMIKESLI